MLVHRAMLVQIRSGVVLLYCSDKFSAWCSSLPSLIDLVVVSSMIGCWPPWTDLGLFSEVGSNFRNKMHLCKELVLKLFNILLAGG